MRGKVEHVACPLGYIVFLYHSHFIRTLLTIVVVIIIMVSLLWWWTDVAGVYGDVVRVKILFNKKDTALIQFVDATQAQRGKLKCLHINCQPQWNWFSSAFLCCSIFCDGCIFAFCCVCFSFSSITPIDWLGRTSLKWSVLCWMRHKNLNSINVSK